MKRLIAIVLIALMAGTSCFTGQVEYQGLPERDSEAKRIIQACQMQRGNQRLNCTLEMGAKFVEVYNATPRVVERRVLNTSGDWQQVLYVIEIDVLVVHVLVSEQNETWFDKAKEASLWTTLGLVLGIVIKLL